MTDSYYNSTVSAISTVANDACVFDFHPAYRKIYYALMGLTIVCGFIGSPLNCILTICCLKVRLWPKNVRFLLANKAFVACLLQAYLAAFTMYTVLRAAAFDSSTLKWDADGEDILVAPTNAVTCAFIHSGFLILCPTAIMTLVGIAIERSLVTFEKITYENEAKAEKLSPKVAGVVVACWIFGFVSVLVFWLQSLAITRLCQCQLFLIMHKDFVVSAIPLFLLLELCLSAMFLYILRLTKTKLADFSINTATHSLTSRYQLTETIGITDMLKPSILTHSACWILSFATAIPIYFYAQGDTRSDFVSCINACFPLLLSIHGLLHPIISFRRSVQLRKTLKRLCSMESDAKVADIKGSTQGNSSNKTVKLIKQQTGITPLQSQKIIVNIWEQAKK